MNTMVVELLTLTVTEQTPACTGLAGDVECAVDGVYVPDDASVEAVSARIGFGVDMTDRAGRKQRPKYLYLSGDALEALECKVTPLRSDDSYIYAPQLVHRRTQRYVLGAGIYDTHLSFELQSDAADPFVIEQASIELLTSNARRL